MSKKIDSNPYVGPRPFETGEFLHGRDNEINDLYYRLSAQRIVLLHSPSGAGKSSLVQAGLIPRLRERFDVWRPTRVNQELPPDTEGNRYVISALRGFEEGIPNGLRCEPDRLAELTLEQYVERRPRRPDAPKNIALIFDQFEEVLTTDLLNTDAKIEFFDQLGEMLRNPGVWALFVIREDYLAPLDPYVGRVPTHLRNHFRIDLLGLDAARTAMVEPARRAGRDFPAADQLLQNLAMMKVQQPDGTFQERAGNHVEPVQLQIVCHKLWEDMDTDDTSIDPEDVEKFGNVNDALGAYYASAVKKAANNEEEERSIREWFDRKLITSGEIRSQVLREVEASGGLDNELIEMLCDSHLLRAEQRAGATWYELAHDRLVKPVLRNNEVWRGSKLTQWQQQAVLWAKQERPPELLLADKKLQTALREAPERKLDDVDQSFLKESEKAQQEREHRQKRQRDRFVRRLAVAAVVVAGLLGYLLIEAKQQTKIAEIARHKALEQTKIAKEQIEIAEIERQRAEMQYRRAEEEAQAALQAVDAAKTSSAVAQQALAKLSEEDQNAILYNTQTSRGEVTLTIPQKSNLVTTGTIAHKPEASTTDLLDVSRGARIVGAKTASDEFGAANMLGQKSKKYSRGSSRVSVEEEYNTVFQNYGYGFEHRVQWTTARPVTLKSIVFFAKHDLKQQRRISRFEFFYQKFLAQKKSEWIPSIIYAPSTPYGGDLKGVPGWGAAPAGDGLAICFEFPEEIQAQEFQAIFVEENDGPQVMELDGYSVPCEQVPGVRAEKSIRMHLLDKAPSQKPRANF